jgi:hypothetical protein
MDDTPKHSTCEDQNDAEVHLVNGVDQSLAPQQMVCPSRPAAAMARAAARSPGRSAHAAVKAGIPSGVDKRAL